MPTSINDFCSSAAAWDNDADRLEVVFDGEPVHVPAVANARWEAPAVPALSLTRTKAANGVAVELAGVFRIAANAVPITEEDSRVHNYGLTASRTSTWRSSSTRSPATSTACWGRRTGATT